MYIQVIISDLRHRALKSHRINMDKYNVIVKRMFPASLPVITTMDLWQLMHLVCCLYV